MSQRCATQGHTRYFDFPLHGGINEVHIKTKIAKRAMNNLQRGDSTYVPTIL